MKLLKLLILVIFPALVFAQAKDGVTPSGGVCPIVDITYDLAINDPFPLTCNQNDRLIKRGTACDSTFICDGGSWVFWSENQKRDDGNVMYVATTGTANGRIGDPAKAFRIEDIYSIDVPHLKTHYGNYLIDFGSYANDLTDFPDYMEMNGKVTILRNNASGFLFRKGGTLASTKYLNIDELECRAGLVQAGNDNNWFIDIDKVDLVNQTPAFINLGGNVTVNIKTLNTENQTTPFYMSFFGSNKTHNIDIGTFSQKNTLNATIRNMAFTFGNTYSAATISNNKSYIEIDNLNLGSNAPIFSSQVGPPTGILNDLNLSLKIGNINMLNGGLNHLNETLAYPSTFINGDRFNVLSTFAQNGLGAFDRLQNSVLNIDYRNVKSNYPIIISSKGNGNTEIYKIQGEFNGSMAIQFYSGGAEAVNNNSTYIFDMDVVCDSTSVISILSNNNDFCKIIVRGRIETKAAGKPVIFTNQDLQLENLKLIVADGTTTPAIEATNNINVTSMNVVTNSLVPDPQVDETQGQAWVRSISYQ